MFDDNGADKTKTADLNWSNNNSWEMARFKLTEYLSVTKGFAEVGLSAIAKPATVTQVIQPCGKPCRLCNLRF